MKKDILPYTYSTANKGKQIQHMFDSIAKDYDKLNTILSLQIDKIWRKYLLKKVIKNNPKRILDVATGTGDIALFLSKKLPEAKVTGIDISKEMLQIAQQKDTLKKVVFVQKNIENLDFTKEEFDAITVTFGIRNFQNINTGIQEIYRVLHKGGSLYILEFGQPRYFIIRYLYNIYSKYCMPLLGKIFAKNFIAYSYLAKSSKYFPCGEDFINILRECGFNKLSYRSLSLGICYYYEAQK